MTCPICDQKPANCDCTAEERRQFSEIWDLQAEIELLRGYRDEAEAEASIASLAAQRLRLTDAEREAVERQARSLERDAERSGMIGLQEMLMQDAATLRGLLERTRATGSV